MNQELAILTGSSAGATESFVVVPFELVKIKQVMSYPPPQKNPSNVFNQTRLQDKSSTFAGPMDVVKQIIQKEGILGMHLVRKHVSCSVDALCLMVRVICWYGVHILAASVVERGLFRMHLQSSQHIAQARGMSVYRALYIIVDKVVG